MSTARRTQVMAILNLTPDSFSDGGSLLSLDAVLRKAHQAIEAGADILDVGGESTRPGAAAISTEEECRRVIQAIRALHQAFPTTPLSIDTRKAAVARAALEAGASLINDVSGLQFDPNLARLAAKSSAKLIIMHSQGTPDTMQKAPQYTDVVAEVKAFLLQQAAFAERQGVFPADIILDPGFGFGKTISHNLTLLTHLSQITATVPYPVMVGTSRKSFLTVGDASLPPQERDALTAASLALAIQQGASMVRVHNPATQIPVIRLAEAMADAAPENALKDSVIRT